MRKAAVAISVSCRRLNEDLWQISCIWNKNLATNARTVLEWLHMPSKWLLCHMKCRFHPYFVFQARLPLARVFFYHFIYAMCLANCIMLFVHWEKMSVSWLPLPGVSGLDYAMKCDEFTYIIAEIMYGTTELGQLWFSYGLLPAGIKP